MSYLNRLIDTCVELSYRRHGIVPCSSHWRELGNLVPIDEVRSQHDRFIQECRNYHHASEALLNWRIETVCHRYPSQYLNILCHHNIKITNAFLTRYHIVPEEDTAIMGYLFRLYFSVGCSLTNVLRFIDNANERSFYSTLPNNVLAARFRGQSRRSILRLFAQRHLVIAQKKLYSNDVPLKNPSIF